MIRAVVLDIDGVILGNLKGINFPHPSKKVKEAILDIHNKGIPVSFLSAKPAFTAYENIKSVGIDNPHVASNGGVIFNPVQDKVIHVESIKERDVIKILNKLPQETYINLIGVKEYYLKKLQRNKFTDIYAGFVGPYPVLVDSFDQVLRNEPIAKINIYAFSKEEEQMISDLLEDLSDSYNFVWGGASQIRPVRVLVITVKGISKLSGVEYLSKYLKIPLSDILGVGDEILDWNFLKVCGYKAVMGNGIEELKNKLDLKDPHQMIGKHVDEDGLLDVFKYFKLL